MTEDIKQFTKELRNWVEKYVDKNGYDIKYKHLILEIERINNKYKLKSTQSYTNEQNPPKVII